MKQPARRARKSAGLPVEGWGRDRTQSLAFIVRSGLISEIIGILEKRNLSHAEVAALAGTSRTRVTAITNWDVAHVSTDLLLRVLGALGAKAKVVFERAP